MGAQGEHRTAIRRPQPLYQYRRIYRQHTFDEKRKVQNRNVYTTKHNSYIARVGKSTVTYLGRPRISWMLIQDTGNRAASAEGLGSWGGRLRAPLRSPGIPHHGHASPALRPQNSEVDPRVPTRGNNQDIVEGKKNRVAEQSAL